MKLKLIKLPLMKQHSNCFKLLDVHKTGLICKSELAFHIENLQDILLLVPSRLPDWEDMKVDSGDLNIQEFQGIFDRIVI